MNIPTLSTKAVFTAKDINSNLHFGHKTQTKKSSVDVWSHAPIKRGNR